MKVGDLVMFDNEQSRYAKWFYGKMGIIESYTSKSKSKHKVPRASCRVKWLVPVEYFDRYTSVSDLGADNFSVQVT